MVQATLRDAVDGDAAAIAALYNHYIETGCVTFEVTPVDDGEIAQRLAAVAEAGLPWLIAEHGDGRLLGYAYAGPWRARAAYRHSVESSIYLDPAACGQGLGRRLYAALLDALATRPVHAVIGGVTLPNPASARLHEALGFTRVAHFPQVGFKHGRWLDVGYWQRLLGDDPGADADRDGAALSPRGAPPPP